MKKNGEKRDFETLRNPKIPPQCHLPQEIRRLYSGFITGSWWWIIPSSGWHHGGPGSLWKIAWRGSHNEWTPTKWKPLAVISRGPIAPPTTGISNPSYLFVRPSIEAIVPFTTSRGPSWKSWSAHKSLKLLISPNSCRLQTKISTHFFDPPLLPEASRN